MGRIAIVATSLLAGLSLVDAAQLDIASASKEQGVPPKGAKTTSLQSTINSSSLRSLATKITSSLNSKRSATATDVVKTTKKITTTTKKVTTTKKKTTTPKKKTTTPKKKTTAKKKVAAKKKIAAPKKKIAAPKKKVVVEPKKKVVEPNSKVVSKEETLDEDAAGDVEVDGPNATIDVASADTVRLQARAVTPISSGAGCASLSNVLYGYVAPGDTGDQVGTGFITDSTLAGFATSNAYPPAGFFTEFVGAAGALFAQKYVGYLQLPRYDTSLCAAACLKNPNCESFNIYAERTPKYLPNANCPNPAPLAAITCALWGDLDIDNTTATNYGQYKNDFMVVITGSNGYTAWPTPPTIGNYSAPNPLVAAIDPNSAGVGYLAQKSYSTWSPQVCAQYCADFTAAARAKAASTYTPCNYFNVFNATYNGAQWVMYCLLYSNSDPSSGATLRNQTSGSNFIAYVGSFGYTLYPPDTGTKSTTWKPAPTGTAASCSSLGTTGATITDYNNVKYVIACGYDVQYSADIGNATAPDFYSCFDLCDDLSGCSGFAYLGTTCYFKALAGTSRTPSLAPGVDMAWLPSYAGFGASTVPASISYTTFTSAWTGTTTATTTSFKDVTGYVIVQTPGGSNYKVATVTRQFDQGTATTINYVTTTAPSSDGTATVNVYYPTPTYCTTVYTKGLSNSGVRYGFFSNSAGGKQSTSGYPAYEPTTLKKATPSTTGLASYIGEYNGISGYVVVYGNNMTVGTAGGLAITHTFYLFAGRGTGYYSFIIPYSDDITLVWVGQNALSGYTRSNSAIQQWWTTSTAPQTPQTISFYLTFGTYTPIRVQFGNAGGFGDMRFTILAPDGATLAQTNAGTNSGYLSPDIVTSPCVTSLGAPFPAFGSET